MNSRYIRTKRTRLPSRRRSQELYGSFEDRGRWIKCWNCGFIIDTNRLSAGDGSGITVEDFNFETDRYGEDKYWHGIECSRDDLNYIITLDTSNSSGAILKNGPDNNAITSYYTPRIAKATSGCPACGTKNLP